MKRYFWLILSTILLLWTSAFATYEDFSNQLNTMGLDIGKIESQNSISRYDLARLLNIVECKDCVNPAQDMISKYTQSFWSAFSSWKDFKDISFLGGIYNTASYYYCVAYVGDNVYMRWYPQATSPVCGGQFCGTKDTTTAEFIQVVINILAKYVYKDLALNWKEVNTRVSKLKTESYEAKNFTANDKKSIAEKSTTCENTCALQNKNEVALYLKYCMFNLGKCNMQEIGKIKQGYRPVAELNLLYTQQIIDIDQKTRSNTDKNIDGKTVLETLFKLNGKVDCAFNNDYDCDSRINTKDSCPNTYNPQQKDTDKDTIGDVCDDDIDGDGIKNPIGIVDDNGQIDIAKRTKEMDNCLFTINTDQTDTEKDNIGDACEKDRNQAGIYIVMDKLEWSAPVTTAFSAMTAGNVQSVSRDFGDGMQGEGLSTSHTFVAPGIYNVQATVKWAANEATAQVIVVIGGQWEETQALQTRASLIGGKANTESMLSATTAGKFDEIERSFPRENSIIKKSATDTVKKIFKEAWEHPVMIKGYKNGKLAGVSYFTIGIGEGKWAILRSNVTTSETNQKILLDTKTYNINQMDIVSVDRDFGDGKVVSNTTMTIEYAYTNPGKKIVKQTITLKNGIKITNMLTIYITDKASLASYALLMIPSKLIANIGEKIDFSTRIVGKMTKTPITQIAEFADGTTLQKPGTEKTPGILVHTYQKNWVMKPQDSIYIDQCTYLKSQSTIVIKWIDACLDAKIADNMKYIYKCDLDGDTLPDICDTDMDNDGIPNLLWMINFENKNCAYEKDTTNANANLSQDTLIKHYQWVCSLDNAPFNNNPDQLDLNQDGIGDAQEELPTLGNGEALDTDGDGIADTQDLCVTIQETRNGIDDTDGCPEITPELACNNISLEDMLVVEPTQCNQCPCQYSDFASDLNNNDQVRAILRDKKKTIQYKFSLPRIVDF